LSRLRRLLGLDPQEAPTSSRAESQSETESVRRIAARLEQLEPPRARYLAAFAYVLARVANADLQVDKTEITEMERAVGTLARLEPEQTRWVVEIARSQAQSLGGTENYLVTREFRSSSTREQRAQLVECLFAVAAADGSISGGESAEVLAIAEELGFTRPEALGMRARWRDHLSELQGLPGRS
jgi:uncharacterized tellurite resistance protein B-like protein